MRLKLTAAALVFVAVLALPSTALAERTLGLSSGTFSFEVQPGGEASGTVDVMNDGDEPLTVLAYAADQKIDDKGSITYEVPGRDQALSLDGPAAWITLVMPEDVKSVGNVPTIELAPGERVPVSFSIDVPSKVPAGDHNLLVFFEMQGENPEGQAGSTVAGRLGARVRLRVAGNLQRGLEVRPFTVPSIVFGRTVPYSFIVRNEGNVDERITAAVTLLDRNEATVGESTAIDAKTVFAQSNLAAAGKLDSVKQLIGPQTVLLTVTPAPLDGSTDSISSPIEEQRTVWMIPYWAAAAVVILALGLLAAVVNAIARTRRKGAGADTTDTSREDFSI